MWEFQRSGTVRGESDVPFAIETELGWVLSGPLKRRYEFSEAGVQELSVNIISQDSAGLGKASLDREVSRLWDVESVGIKRCDEVHESFENEIQFLEGRYSVKLPWKLGHDPLPNNFANSLSRMKSQFKRLNREPRFDYKGTAERRKCPNWKSRVETSIVYPTMQLFLGMQRPRN